MFWIYGTGLVVFCTYFIFCDAAWSQFLLLPEMFSWLPFRITIRIAHKIQSIGAAAMLMFPCIYFLIREWRNARNLTQIAFLFGAFLFGSFVVFASLTPQTLSLLYIASIFSALCWCWAVFRDLRDMKGRAALLKDELQWLVQSGQAKPGLEMEKLLDNLDRISEGNIDVYKMRVREILSRLTDVTIEAGGNMDQLVQRNTDRSRDIDFVTDAAGLREIVRVEAEELSGMIADIPEKKKNEAVEKAQAFIRNQYHTDFGVEEIADVLGISKAHLMREFKKETSKTVNQFLTALRIEKGKELLLVNTVTDTAFDVGYNDPNYFSTVF